MPRGKGIYDDQTTAEPKRQADRDLDSRTIDQDDTPDVTETDEEPTA